ncbi:hypothetical protein OS493_036523 [Desmophyllum pertusum]|uniref:Uncharacterized protein n=1 Tax=Desmophyllum pertusum TaxID=174260 RepID=A0A9W9ZI97_9CNID|nr:hypothetical protein OS493_036523 [Desmophyllum pertusum]
MPVIKVSGIPVIKVTGFPVIKESGMPVIKVTRDQGIPVIKVSSEESYHPFDVRILRKFKSAYTRKFVMFTLVLEER